MDTILTGRHVKRGADERAKDEATEDYDAPAYDGKHTRRAVRLRRLEQDGYGDPDKGCPCPICVDYRAQRAERIGATS